MLGFGALAELALAEISEADSEANATPFSEVYEAPSADRIYLVELYPYQPAGSS